LSSSSSKDPSKPALVPDARRVALEALIRIDQDGAYANLLLPKLLGRSGLPDRDRAFATELVYGTTRHRRACDWFVDRFVLGDLDPTVRAALRLGTYQLRMLGTPAHAGVSATVDVVPRKVRGLVNAVLRKVATAEDAWPSDAVRLSYPDWVLDRLAADLGAERTEAALQSMNGAASATARDDGYIQDRASQWVAAAVGARPGERVLDVCAAPGGKATALASNGAFVAAADLRPARARLVADNATRLGLAPSSRPWPTEGDDVSGLPDAGATTGSPRSPAGRVAAMVADGTRPPFVPASFDRVLIDAPCSGLGSLRRRPDARWRIDAEAPERLAALQRALLDAAAPLVRPGGTLTYSVCTLTVAETSAVADAFRAGHPGWAPTSANDLDPAWEPWGSGHLLLPQSAGTDGMALFSWAAP
jgi:16S rRNA (cytosine967-C5)-methyltransferase